MRNVNVVQVFQGLGGFSKGEAEVDVEGQAQGHNVGIMFAEFQGRGVLGESIQIHAEKIHRELTVDIVEFIFVFAVVLPEIFFVYFFEIVEIIRAFGISALMDDKMFAFFLGNQGMATVGTAQFHRGKAAFGG